jgi:hypothetical protein
MRRAARTLSWIVIALTVVTAWGCDEGGIGMGVPASGARWSGPGPDVLVGGGPR